MAPWTHPSVSPYQPTTELCANSLTSQGSPAWATPQLHSLPASSQGNCLESLELPPKPDWVFQCLMLLIQKWEREAPTLVWEGAAHPLLPGGMEPPLAKLSRTKGVAPKSTLLARLSFPLHLPGQTHGQGAWWFLLLQGMLRPSRLQPHPPPTQRDLQFLTKPQMGHLHL